jgi:EF-P beta-lysylation protein EpmB
MVVFEKGPVIPQTEIIHPTDNWQRQLRDTITSGEQLLAMLELDPAKVGFSPQACADFALKVPLAFARRMETGNPEDPLLLQILASQLELQQTPGYHQDPVGETGETIPHKGIIHKYKGRALLIVSGNCAINCRYCFRRHFPYSDNQNSRQQWRTALQYIRDDHSIKEVILSGGDPLVLGDRQLQELFSEIAAIPHVTRLRIHSRLPIVIPDRITPTLLNAISHNRLKTVMVVHCNHANEIDAAVAAAMTAMHQRDITLLNQTVLLAGVNDDATALANLSEKLFSAAVLPYYLHLLDKVQGAAHFDIPETLARGLLGEISSQLPGYLVPKLVREMAGATSKVGLSAIL